MGSVPKMRFGGPAEANTDRYRNADHFEHVVAFVNATETEVDTKYGTAVVAKCDDVVCIDCETHFGPTKVFGQVMVPALVDADAEIVVARITQGQGTNGNSAPWLLGTPSEVDLAQAEDFLGVDDDEEAF